MRNKYCTSLSLWDDPLRLLENSYPNLLKAVEEQIINNSSLQVDFSNPDQLLNGYKKIEEWLKEIFKNYQIPEEDNPFKSLIKFIILRQNNSLYYNWMSETETLKRISKILDEQIPNSLLNLQNMSEQQILVEELEKGKKNTTYTSISKIQTMWRQNYRAKKLHRDPNLFGNSSKDTRINSLIILPKEFRNLLDCKIPSLIQEVTHVSVNIKNILRDGKIYSKQKTWINGIGKPTDAERKEHRLVFTSPWYNYGKNFEKITLSIKSLFEDQSNRKEAVYFKFVDWGEEVSKTEFEITDHIKIVSNLNDNPSCFEFFKNNQSIAVVKLGWEHLVYHGLEGLNEYLTFFIFKVLNKLPLAQQYLKTEIYHYFEKLDEDILILHLQTWMRKLLFVSEFDFVNDLKLNFESIIDVCLPQRAYKIDFFALRQTILAEQINTLEYYLVKNAEIYQLFSNSYVLAKGMLDYATKVKANKSAQFIQDQFKIIGHCDSLVEKNKFIYNELNFESFNINLLLNAMQNRILEKNTPLINISSLANIEKITRYCNHKYTDQSFFGNDALNRKILLDDYIAQYLDSDTVLQILHLANFQKGAPLYQVKRNSSGHVTLADILKFGFLLKPTYLKFLPNNESNYDKEQYNIQKFKFERNTKKIMMSIFCAAQKIDIDVQDKKYTISNTTLPSLVDRFQTIVQKITEIKNNKNSDLLLYVPSYSANEIRLQAREGFELLWKALVGPKSNSVLPLNVDLKKFVHHIFLNQHVLLDGNISHLFYDRVHLEACIESNFRFVLYGKLYTIIELLILLFKKADEENVKGLSSIVAEQFDARFALIEKHLEQFTVSSSYPLSPISPFNSL